MIGCQRETFQRLDKEEIGFADGLSGDMRTGRSQQ